MAIKIIKNATTCFSCNAVFSYDEEDIYITDPLWINIYNGEDKYAEAVNCPKCNSKCIVRYCN